MTAEAIPSLVGYPEANVREAEAIMSDWAMDNTKKVRKGLDEKNKERRSSFIAAGLITRGQHLNVSEVVALTREGRGIAISVAPMLIDEGRGTYFVPRPEQSGKMSQIFPPPERRVR